MSSRPLAIHVEGLWKTYRIQQPDRARRLWRGPKVEFHALREVTFEVPEGAVLGIVGRNGAGKSTLLKILSRITDPSRGRVRVAGRVASLLEVGTGFHPELTGLENLYLNAAIHGLKRREVRQRLDAILAFAEIGDFLNEPVKRYSSGMYLRLAFSIAAHLDPDVFIVDELLAVGDVAFRERCLGRLKDVAGSGRTVVLVSHDSNVIRGLCTDAIYLSRGEVIHAGEAKCVIQEYLDAQPAGQGNVHLDRRQVGLDKVAARYSLVGPGASAVEVEMTLRAQEAVSDLTVDLMLISPGGARIAHIMGCVTKQPRVDLAQGRCATWRFRLELPELAPGVYMGEVYLESRGWEGQLHVSDLRLFDVGPSPTRVESTASNFTGLQLPPYTSRIEIHD